MYKKGLSIISSHENLNLVFLAEKDEPTRNQRPRAEWTWQGSNPEPWSHPSADPPVSQSLPASQGLLRLEKLAQFVPESEGHLEDAERPSAREVAETAETGVVQQVSHVERDESGVSARLRRQGHPGIREELPN